MTIRVAIVNDYEVVVRGLATMLEPIAPIDIVELDAGADVVTEVDVALYDTFAQIHANGAEVRNLAANPRVGKLAIYTWGFTAARAEGAIAEGARGYLSKSLTAEELSTALQAIHAGDIVVAGGVNARIQRGGDWPGKSAGLTPREAEVLALITQGKSNVEIAQECALSVNSVKSYIRTAYRKIGVTDRTHAILWGVDHDFRPDRTRERR